MTEPLLLPRPRRARFTGRRLREPAGPAQVATDVSLPAEGYRLRIGEDAVTIDAADPAGEAHARRTLDQLRHGDGLPEGDIDDWPDLAVRGLMQDVSRDRVPTLESLIDDVVPRLAGWKLNHLQLYMEHTFAYRDHEEVWRDASPFTPAQVTALDAVCGDHHVELAANQNCLGHWERWLAHDRYRPLAIHPDGFEFFGRHRGPTTLDPANPDARRLVASLLEELLPNFASRRVHVGLDEPWELPAERFGDYLDWIRWLRGLDAVHDHDVLMWGDVIASHPDQLADLPDMTVCEWGYEADHPFAARAARYESEGRPFWVCPGTSSWLSIAGRWANMQANIAAAADAAVGHGAAGLLVTDWGDLGHLQPPVVSLPGIAYAAAMSWCAASNRDVDLARAVSTHALGDPTGNLGDALRELGLAHTELRPQVPNCSTLVLHLYRPRGRVGVKATTGLGADQLDRAEARVDAAVAHLRAGGGHREIEYAVALLDVLIADARARLGGDLTLAGIPEPERLRLAGEMDGVIEAHRSIWEAHSRPGGYADSAAWLERLRDAYRTGRAEPA